MKIMALYIIHLPLYIIYLPLVFLIITVADPITVSMVSRVTVNDSGASTIESSTIAIFPQLLFSPIAMENISTGFMKSSPTAS